MLHFSSQALSTFPKTNQLLQISYYNSTTILPKSSSIITKNNIIMSSNDNSSTLQSYVDSAVGAAQSVIASVTGNPADKVRLSNPNAAIFLYFYAYKAIAKSMNSKKQTAAKPKLIKNSKTRTPQLAWALSLLTPTPAPQ